MSESELTFYIHAVYCFPQRSNVIFGKYVVCMAGGHESRKATAIYKVLFVKFISKLITYS